eukprot:gnl/Dysnectes_brevis/156_a183_4147.p1 GENE.gnl/Dysnectes_brevis/156_a183_4147~~gnl/Dysnectes_brevis/156_a183_4147.p1  ORF type:complete len:770 (-),score=373.88 gnl/Dysnectes_brevis/156_a183_4147:62-2371(-)
MIAINPKVRKDRVNVQDILSRFTEQQFKKADKTMLGKVAPAYAKFYTLREQLTSITSYSQEIIEKLLELYVFEEFFLDRFPWGSKQLKAAKFAWADSFNPSYRRHPICPNLALDRAALLFNVGAVYSHLAVEEDTTAPKGWAKASGNFKKAADSFQACLDRVKTDLGALGTTSPDLTVDGLSGLVQMMIAQAHEAAIRQAERDRRPAVLIASLCVEVSTRYASVIKHFSFQLLEKNMHPSFMNFAHIKKSLFLAKAHFLVGSQLISGDTTTGEILAKGIANFIRTKTLIDEITGTKRFFRKGAIPSDILGLYRQIKSSNESKLHDSIDRNNQVYHADVGTYEAIKPRCLAKIAPKLPVAHINGETDPLRCLIPPHISVLVQQYTKRAETALEAMADKYEAEAGKFKAHMSGLSLPQCLWAALPDQAPEDAKKEAVGGPNMPSSMQDTISQFMDAGAIQSVLNAQSEVTTVAQECNAVAQEASSIIAALETQDAQFAQHYPGRWLSAPFRGVLNQHKHQCQQWVVRLQVAAGTDKHANSLIVAGTDAMTAIPKLAAELKKRGSGDSVDPELKAAAEALRDIYHLQLAADSDREAVDQKARELLGADKGMVTKFMDLGVKSAKDPQAEGLIVTELGKYSHFEGEYTVVIGAMLARQSEIDRLHADFEAKKKASVSAQRIEGEIAQIKEGLAQSQAILALLAQGKKFYGAMRVKFVEMKQRVEFLRDAYAKDSQTAQQALCNPAGPAAAVTIATGSAEVQATMSNTQQGYTI